MTDRDARFARARDLRALRTPDHGLFLGYHGWLRRTPLLSDQPGHALVVAPSRTGKGVGLLMPTALSWPTSMIILDPKGEFRETTLHWRTQFQEECFTWGPTTFSTRWNPLAEIAVLPDDQQLERAMQLAAAFTARENSRSSGNDQFWNDKNNAILAHLFLWAATARPDACATLGHVYELLSRTQDLDRLLRSLRDSPRHELATFAHGLLSETDNVASNISSAGRATLRSFASPAVRDATSDSELSYSALMKPRRTLYLHASATDFSTHGQLLTAFLAGFAARAMSDLHALDEPLLLLLDEFSLLPALPSIKTLLTLAPGYNIRLLVVLQDLTQVSHDVRNLLLSNCHDQVFFAARDTATLDELAKKLGTVWRKSISKSRNRSGSSRSESLRKEDLLAPHQIKAMKHALLFHGQAPAARVSLRPYFQDKRFTPRLGQVLPPTPTPLTPLPLADFLADPAAPVAAPAHALPAPPPLDDDDADPLDDDPVDALDALYPDDDDDDLA